MRGILLRRMLCVLAGWLGLHHDALAGGSGLNALVIVNQASSNSCELGNYYCTQRGVPPQNLLRINWTGGNISWTSNDFQNTLLAPLLNALAQRQLTNQVNYVVLSMDIPFQVLFSTNVNSTTAALFYGLKRSDGTDPGVTNSYAGSESIFAQAPPASAAGSSFLTTMITANSLADAEHLVDQGVSGDGTFPAQPVILAKSSDPSRNIRYPYFDNAIFDANILGASTILRTNSDTLWVPGGCLGYETGLAQFGVPTNSFVPGAIADDMTSFGGIIFGPNTQTNLLEFVEAGASGSYGTVAEPGTDTQKFPNPLAYFYQARGFNIAESYYQSVNAPCLGLFVADPLAAPFAIPGHGVWSSGLSNSILAGVSNLTAQFCLNSARPIQQVDLFVDGTYTLTLTNIAPCAGNVLSATLNGYPVNYTVPPGASVLSVASGLAAQISAASAVTLVQASAHGDRVELQCTATNPLLSPYYVFDTSSYSSSSPAYGVSCLDPSTPPQLLSTGMSRDGLFAIELAVPTALPCFVLASTNLINWSVVWTNSNPGLQAFVDPDTTNFWQRFYRLATPNADVAPTISAVGPASGGGFQVHVQSLPGQPCSILSSPNLINWASLVTNQAGGSMDFVDNSASGASQQLYRAQLVAPVPPPFAVSTNAVGGNWIAVSNASQPYVIGVSTNQGQWLPLQTNFAIGQILTSAGSSTGTGSTLSTFLTASQPALLNSVALGVRTFTMISNSVSIGAWLQFTITKTNGQAVAVTVTNQSPGASSADLASQLCSQINSTPGLQGVDGISAQDLVVNPSGTINFNIFANSPGCQSTAIRVVPKKSAGLILLPSYPVTLSQNLSDLEPRNHLYITAGATNLSITFPLDTTTLADGFHELKAVAYGGDSVNAETIASVPVWIQNTSLSATMTLLDLPNPAPISGSYHIQVAANTNTVSLITLYSTGGILGTATNLSLAAFEVDGTNLWAGLHPFYAVVQTSDGLSYRTENQWVQFVH